MLECMHWITKTNGSWGYLYADGRRMLALNCAACGCCAVSYKSRRSLLPPLSLCSLQLLFLTVCSSGDVAPTHSDSLLSLHSLLHQEIEQFCRDVSSQAIVSCVVMQSIAMGWDGMGWDGNLMLLTIVTRHFTCMVLNSPIKRSLMSSASTALPPCHNCEERTTHSPCVVEELFMLIAMLRPSFPSPDILFCGLLSLWALRWCRRWPPASHITWQPFPGSPRPCR